MNSRIAALLVALSLAGGAGAAEPIATVLALEGSANAADHELHRGDAVQPGSVVRTDAGGRIGLLVSEIYVQLDPQSALRLDRDAEGNVRLALEAGRARVVDTRAGGQPAAFAAGGAEAAIAGGDSEIYLLSEKTGRYAMFCEWEGPLAVAKDPRALVAAPGSCVLVKPGEAPYLARGHDHQIPLLPGADPKLQDAIASRFATPPVAAGPYHGFPGPFDVPDRERDPCDVPGSGCAGGLVIVEPPPDIDFCAPGVPCEE